MAVKSVYGMVTDRIIEQLKHNPIPWQKHLQLYNVYFSLSGATVCMRAKKDSAFPVLKYSYQNSSVSA